MKLILGKNYEAITVAESLMIKTKMDNAVILGTTLSIVEHK